MGDVLQVGPLRLRFESSDPEVEARMDALFAAFPRADSGDDEKVVSIEPDERDERRVWRAEIDGHRVRRAVELAAVEESLTRHINRMVLDAEDDRLHLHAGAVERDGHVVLIIGPSGSGKSTLVASLVAAGWALLSDEQLGVLEGGRLVPFPRPITLRRNSWPLFESLELDEPADRVDRLEVPLEHLGVAFEAELAPCLVIAPDVSVADHTVERLSVAEVVAALVTDTLDLERAGDEGVERILEIAAAAPGVRVTGTELDASHAAIERLLVEAEPPGQVLDEERPAGDDDCRAPASRAWLFPDRSAAIYDRDGGALAVIDEAGFEAWRALGHPREQWLPEMADSPFVLELEEAGLIRQPLELEAP